MSTTISDGKSRIRVGAFLIYLLSVVLTGSAVAKFAQVPKVATQMAAIGFDRTKLVFIAVLELASAILFAYPRTRSLGLTMVSAYLGGAMAAHVAHNQSPVQPAVVLALSWIAVSLRHPETLWSLRRTSS